MPRVRHTILLVDDNALTRMAAALLLKDLGHQVIEVRSGAEALAVLGAGSAVDMVITDLLMPGMTGGQLAAAVHALQPDLPVVISTGYGRTPDDGTADLPRLDKPYDRDDLAATIARVMATRKPPS
jgi:CheY-like chemotaxis protein